MLTMCLKSTLNLQLTNDQLKRGIPFSQLVCIRDFFSLFVRLFTAKPCTNFRLYFLTLLPSDQKNMNGRSMSKVTDCDGHVRLWSVQATFRPHKHYKVRKHDGLIFKT